MIEAGRRRYRSSVIRHPESAARRAGADQREGEAGRATEGARVTLPEARRQGHEQLEFLAAPRRRARRHAGPAGNPLELDLDLYTRRRGELTRVTRQSIRDVDQRAGAAAREPAPGGDAGLRVGEAAG